MTDIRCWTLSFFLTAPLLSVSGCGGGSPSASKSYDHFVAAVEALEAGDKETAFRELSVTIERSPNSWAYFERARLLVDQGRDEEARADCQKGLELAPQDPRLQWLSNELEKPADQRFQGKFAEPPRLRREASG